MARRCHTMVDAAARLVSIGLAGVLRAADDDTRLLQAHSERCYLVGCEAIAPHAGVHLEVHGCDVARPAGADPGRPAGGAGVSPGQGRRRAAGQPPHGAAAGGRLDLRDGGFAVSDLKNISSHPGYDNQPAFTSDGRSVLFTSVREDAQADIYRYDVAARTIARVTTTRTV